MLMRAAACSCTFSGRCIAKTTGHAVAATGLALASMSPNILSWNGASHHQ